MLFSFRARYKLVITLRLVGGGSMRMVVHQVRDIHNRNVLLIILDVRCWTKSFKSARLVTFVCMTSLAVRAIARPAMLS